MEQALGLIAEFRRDEACDGTLVHTDLHYGNVLAARQRPGRDETEETSEQQWVVIDPKPLSGDPHYEVAPLLVNRFAELAGDVRGGLRRRFEAVVDTALLQEDRARDWVVVRMLVTIGWAVEGLRGPVGEADKEWITRCVTIAKAVQ